MPNIPQPQRQDEPVVTDADLAALLAGTTDAPPGLWPVADVLAALTAEPTSMELTGEASALAEFRRQAGAPVPAQRARRSTAGFTSRFGVKAGASVTAVAVILGGGAAAAFADVLPAPIQRLAHEAIGAPIPPPRHDLPAHSRPGAHGRPGGYGQSGMPGRSATVHGKDAARGGPGASRQLRPHATPAPTAHDDPQGQGKYGNQGQAGQGSSQGHQGSGQRDQGNSQGHHGNGQSQGNSQRQGNSQGQGKIHGQQDKAPLGPANQGSPHNKGPHGNSQANRWPAGHPRRSAHTRPVMDH